MERVSNPRINQRFINSQPGKFKIPICAHTLAQSILNIHARMMQYEACGWRKIRSPVALSLSASFCDTRSAGHATLKRDPIMWIAKKCTHLSSISAASSPPPAAPPWTPASRSLPSGCDWPSRAIETFARRLHTITRGWCRSSKVLESTELAAARAE